MVKSIKNKAVYEADINGFTGKASSIVFPDSMEEVRRLVSISQIDIIPRGAGISFSGQCVPNDSVIIDLSKMKKILEIDSLKRTVYLESGVVIDELNEELEKYGLELPISPIFSGIRTIGGILASNADTLREIKYGKIKNWTDSLEVINGKAELINISKTDSGDFIGMEGTTGVIMRARLKLTNKKKRTLSILRTDNFEEIIKAGKKLKLDNEVSILALFGKKLSKMIGLDNRFHLFVEYESDKGNLKEERYKEFISKLKNFYFSLARNNYTFLEDPRFFMDRLPEFLMFLEEGGIPYFANIGSGTIYCGFKQSEKEKRDLTLELVRKLRAKITDSLGIGLIKKKLLEKSEIDIIKRIKLRQDPNNKFNREKLIDSIIILKPNEPGEEKIEKEKTAEQDIEEFIEEQKIDDFLKAEPIDLLKEEREKKDNISEEQEIKKIVEEAGFG